MRTILFSGAAAVEAEALCDAAAEADALALALADADADALALADALAEADAALDELPEPLEHATMNSANTMANTATTADLTNRLRFI